MNIFPFWTSKQIITYSELQKFCKKEYEQRSDNLIQSIEENLEKLLETQTRDGAFKVLLFLDQQALILSCFSSEWVDFSVAVFELEVLPLKTSTVWMYKCLKNILEITKRRVYNGVSTTNN